MLGKLKIPGYSDYLHPYDETHIIGIGKDTIEADEGLYLTAASGCFVCNVLGGTNIMPSFWELYD